MNGYSGIWSPGKALKHFLPWIRPLSSDEPIDEYAAVWPVASCIRSRSYWDFLSGGMAVRHRDRKADTGGKSDPHFRYQKQATALLRGMARFILGHARIYTFSAGDSSSSNCSCKSKGRKKISY